MTIPHMMNCPHLGDGWCLECVGQLHTSSESHAAMSAEIARLRARERKLVEALKALADKVDATSDCDHKRQSCEDVGCIGAQVIIARAALAEGVNP